MSNNIIGQNKKQILSTLTDDYVEFGHWLYVPSLKILLSFKRQICQSIEML